MARTLEDSTGTGEDDEKIQGLVLTLEQVLTQACDELEKELLLIKTRNYEIGE